jgi:hypothetical protein
LDSEVASKLDSHSAQTQALSPSDVYESQGLPGSQSALQADGVDGGPAVRPGVLGGLLVLVLAVLGLFVLQPFSDQSSSGNMTSQQHEVLKGATAAPAAAVATEIDAGTTAQQRDVVSPDAAIERLTAAEVASGGEDDATSAVEASSIRPARVAPRRKAKRPRKVRTKVKSKAPGAAQKKKKKTETHGQDHKFTLD